MEEGDQVMRWGWWKKQSSETKRATASREKEKVGEGERKQDKAEAFAGFPSKGVGEMAFEEREKWIEEDGKLKEWVRDVEKVTGIK